jgi:hypothetical protein
MPSGTWGSVALAEPLNSMQHLFDVYLLHYNTSFINHFSPNRPTVKPQLDDLDIKIKYRPVYACVGDLNA